MRHRDCEIVIKCDGKVLDEHDVQVEDAVTSCYISSEAGKEFTIWMNNLSLMDTTSNVSVDGRPFPRLVSVRSGVSGALTYRNNASAIRPLMFSDISITDDENTAIVLPDASHLGLVQIHICRCRLDVVIPYKPPTGTGAAAGNFGPLHERAKKGGMHCVSFGDAMKEPVTTLHKVVLIDQVSSPYVTFNFRYRSQAILQAQGIIHPIAEPPLANPASDILDARDAPTRIPLQDLTPSSAQKRPGAIVGAKRPQKRPRHGSASSSVSSVLEMITTRDASPAAESKPLILKDEDVDDEDELSALRAQMRAMEDRMIVLERRRSRTNRARVVKRETSPQAIKAGKFNGDVIDLTDD